MSFFPIFKAGTHRASSGYTRHYSEEDLRLMAAAYSPEARTAPLTIGHPSDDQPRHGLVRKLEAIGNQLFAHVENVTDSMKELLSLA